MQLPPLNDGKVWVICLVEQMVSGLCHHLQYMEVVVVLIPIFWKRRC